MTKEELHLWFEALDLASDGDGLPHERGLDVVCPCELVEWCEALREELRD